MKKCCSCGETISFFSKKHNYQGRIFCEKCYYINYGRYTSPPLPDRLLNKCFSLSNTSWRFSYLGDRILKHWPTQKQYTFHPLLYTEPLIDTSICKYIGIELSTGRIFKITEEDHIDSGPDGVDTSDAKICTLSKVEWEYLLDSFSNRVQAEFKAFSFENAMCFANYSTNIQGYQEAYIVISQNQDGFNLIRSSTVYNHLFLENYTLSFDQYVTFRKQFPSLYDAFSISSNELQNYSQSPKQVYKTGNAEAYRSFKQVLESTKEISNDALSNFFFMKDAGKTLIETHIATDDAARLVRMYKEAVHFETVSQK